MADAPAGTAPIGTAPTGTAALSGRLAWPGRPAATGPGERAGPAVGATGRLIALDALRGIAALTVVLNHALLTVPAFVQVPRLLEGGGALLLSPWAWLRYSPLQILVSGRPAVIFFFVLSGFVLTLPFVAAGAVRYRVFLGRRLVRIWLPAMVAILLAALAKWAVAGLPAPETTPWLAQQWVRPLSLGSIARHLALLGGPDDIEINPVIWSLVHEVRISVVFPLLFLLARRCGATGLLGLGLAVSLAAGFSGYDVNGGGLRATVHFVFPFTLGIVLALRRDAVRAAFQGLTPAMRALCWGATVLGLMAPGRPFLADFVITVAGGLLICLCLSSATAQRGLAHPLATHLGRLSYSLYLVHFTVLLVTLRLVGTQGLAIALPVALLLTWPATEAFHRWVEAPSHRLAHRLRSAR